MSDVRLSRWALRRLMLAVPVVLSVTALTFILIHLAPGDPVYALAGDGGSPAYYTEMRAKYGLDRPLVEQFVRYTRAVLTGDFGYSFMYQAPVVEVVAAHMPASILLGGASLALATIAGAAFGLLGGLAPARRADVAIRVFASVAYAAPVFWTGQLFIILLAVKLGLAPVGGMTSARESLTGIAAALEVVRHLALPAVTLALPFMAIVTRVSRASLIEAGREPFIVAARARGLTRVQVVSRHAAPHAAVPVVALVGEHATQLVAGAALTEALFGWPGVGYLVLHASLHRDYPLVTGAFIVISTGVVLLNALTDLLCAWLDPRIRLA
jgi:peptide/nickel transport system permease protein